MGQLSGERWKRGDCEKFQQFEDILGESFHLINNNNQGGITCGAIDEPRKSSKAIEKRVIIDFCVKNVVIARFRDQNEVFI